MKRKATFGSISHGALRQEDLIGAFSCELRALRGALPVEIARAMRQFERPEWMAEALEDALQEFAPAYGYFGAHPGDGSDFGFWLSESFEDEFDGLKVNDTSEVPKGYRGEVLHVNDHGNITLYVATSRGLREVWGLV